MSYVPYAHLGHFQPPWPPRRTGAVVTYHVYCGLMIAMYVVIAAIGALMAVYAADMAANDPEMSEVEARIMGWIMFGMGLPFAAVHAAPFFFPRRTWAWVVGIVLIAWGLTSCCLWPLCIPLLIYYVQAPTRHWYGAEAPVDAVPPALAQQAWQSQQWGAQQAWAASQQQAPTGQGQPPAPSSQWPPGAGG